jgi:hypothetical protein
MKKLSAFETAQVMIKNTNGDFYGANRIIVIAIIPSLVSEEEITFWKQVKGEIFNIKHGKTEDMKELLEINSDGSLKGTTFTEFHNGVKIEYPHPKQGETYRDYRTRVKKLVDEQKFHLGDLSYIDWGYYCMGSGMYEGVDSCDMIPF